MKKAETLISEVPYTESGLVVYIKSMSDEIGKFINDSASEEKKIIHRRQKYLLKKAQDRLNKIFEAKHQYAVAK